MRILDTAILFGGDDPLLGRPWYHAELTREAARSAGWDPAPSDDLAWFAVHIDLYCFDPTWRYRAFAFPGPLRAWASRYAAVPRLRDPLSTLHFLDLFTPDAVRAFWRRLLSGTPAGLGWAAHDQDVAGARLLTGLSLHAIQDFYAHSTWVNDPGRREVTWFDASEDQRAAADLWSAGHFSPPPPGRASHGKVRRRTGDDPAAPARPRRVFGSRLAARFVELEPGGVTLDAPWMTAQTAVARGFAPEDGAELFEAAHRLALRSSERWLRALDRAMRDAGHGQFWHAVRTERLPRGSRVAAFERPGAVAPLAAAAGAVRGVPETGDHDGWWFGFARLTWGASQDGASQDGGGQDSASQDSASQDSASQDGAGHGRRGRRAPGRGCVVPLGPWPEPPDRIELRGARPAPVRRAEVFVWQRPAAEAGRTEAGRTEAGRTEAGRTEAGRTEAGRTEVGRTEVGRTEVGRTEVGRTEAGRIEVRAGVVHDARLSGAPVDVLRLDLDRGDPRPISVEMSRSAG